MTTPLILRPLVPAAVSSAVATDPSWPVAHVLTQQPRQPAVWPAGGSVDVTVDMGAPQSVDALALIHTDTSAWDLRAADTQAGLDTAAVLASGSTSGSAGVAALWWGAGVVKRWWRVTMTVPAGGHLGRLVLAEAFAPAWPYEWGMVRAHRGAEVQETPGGAIYPSQRLPRRRWQVTWGDISDTEWATHWQQLADYLAAGGEVVFCADYEAAEPASESLYCLASLPQGLTRMRPSRWRAALLLEELV